MILIAESGSTKTDWRLLTREGGISQMQSKGFNPNYQNNSELEEMIQNSISPKISREIEEVHFYGAGCSLPEHIQSISDSFHIFFDTANVQVNHDMLAAARSLCGTDAGIACILGTGANSCFYDGKEIKKNVPSVGYLLGDEGGGSWLGKELLGDFIRENLPQEISQKLKDEHGLTREGIIRKVYGEDSVIQYLSSFSKFISTHVNNPYLYKLVYRNFDLFFQKNVTKYDNYASYPVHVTGSVGYYYSNIMRKVASDLGITLKNVVESPIAGLTLYHLKF